MPTLTEAPLLPRLIHRFGKSRIRLKNRQYISPPPYAPGKCYNGASDMEMARSDGRRVLRGSI
jgi:hypothetical protein